MAGGYQEQLLRLQEEQRRALQDTNNQINQWLKFKSDYEALRNRLHTLPDQVTHDVMVPFGKMAFMPGQLVHTNEILVLLGDNWFAERSAKQAAEIVDRRIEAVDKQLKELTKQKQLLEPRQKFTSELQHLSQEGGEVKEIREEYDEEREKQWKEAHRKHVKEYRSRLKKETEKQQISQAPADTGQTGRTDEELWARLDQLESIESERREMQKIGTTSEKKLEGFSYPGFPHSNAIAEAIKEKDKLPESDHSESDDDEESSYTASDELDSDDDDVAIENEIGEEEKNVEKEVDSKGTLITFSHSHNTGFKHKVRLENTDENSFVSCPGDIYTNYRQSIKPKSILKKSPSGQKKKVKNKTKKSAVIFDTGSENEKDKRQIRPLQHHSLEPAFSGTVVEKSCTELPLPQQMTPAKPVSKFKSLSAKKNTELKKSVTEDSNQTEPVTNKPVSKFKSERHTTRR